MTKQYCVRTYEENYSDFQNNPCGKVNCEILNSYLKYGWKVVMVTPKPKNTTNISLKRKLKIKRVWNEINLWKMRL